MGWVLYGSFVFFALWFAWGSFSDRKLLERQRRRRELEMQIAALPAEDRKWLEAELKLARKND